jgi:hypothetical protein
MILAHLDPVDTVRCRRVSRAWSNAFGNPANLIPILKWTYPRAREVRKLLSDGAFDHPETAFEQGFHHWRTVYDQVTSRYHRLGQGRPRSIQKFDMHVSGDQDRPGWRFFSVPPWDVHSSHYTNRIDHVFEQAFWTYEDGLVVYPDENDRAMTLLDLETEHKFMVPFVMMEKVIRRVRLKDRLLVIEWAELDAFHWLNERDSVHRHFATSFDVHRCGRGWDIVLRNEWKIMFLGHPLGERDRFFSTHSQKHYAIYIWQPNRSLYTADEDAPIESLSIWDISKKSPYRASEDPTGRIKDTGGDPGPSIVARFTFRELGFYAVRQRGIPKIMRLDVDSESHTIDITEVQCVRNADWNCLNYTCSVQKTAIPFVGHGPCWRRDDNTVYPPYRGNCTMEIAPLTAPATFHWFLTVCEATDWSAQVSYCLSYFGTGDSSDNNPIASLVVSIHTPRSISTVSGDVSSQITCRGQICGDERFVVGQNYYGQLVVLRF